MFQKIEQQDPCSARGLEPLGLNSVTTASQKAKETVLSATLSVPRFVSRAQTLSTVWKMMEFRSFSWRGAGVGVGG